MSGTVTRIKKGNKETIPWSKAAIPTMISTAFPKEAFNRPERVWPSFNDNWSVATPNSYNTRKNRSNDAHKTRDELRYLGEGHDSNEAEREPQGGIPTEMVGDEAQRDEHEHNVQPRAKEEKPVGSDPPWLVFGYTEETDNALLVREPARVAVSAMAVLEEGRCIGWRHSGCGREVNVRARWVYGRSGQESPALYKGMPLGRGGLC